MGLYCSDEVVHLKIIIMIIIKLMYLIPPHSDVWLVIFAIVNEFYFNKTRDLELFQRRLPPQTPLTATRDFVSLFASFTVAMETNSLKLK